MRIAHISDLHLNTFFKSSNLRQIKTLVKYALEQEFDHMVVTGDLVDNASARDLEILRNLFRKNNLLDADRLSVITGNHDIFGSPQTPEEIFNFTEKCRNVDYDKKVSEFVEFFSETYNGSIYTNKTTMFPFAKIIDDVLIAGANSIPKYSKIKNPFASNGSIGTGQLEEISNIFTEYGCFCKYKLLLIHHHFNKIKINENSPSSLWQMVEMQTMKLRKKKRLFEMLKGHKVDLVLHGHLHEQKEYNRKGIRFLNSGASINNSTRRKLFLNIIDMQYPDIKLDIHSIDSHLSGKISEIIIPQLEVA